MMLSVLGENEIQLVLALCVGGVGTSLRSKDAEVLVLPHLPVLMDEESDKR